MKKLLGVLLVIVMALFGFSACTNGNTNGNDSGNNGETGGNGIIGGNNTEGGNGTTTNPPTSNSAILIA